MLSKVEKIPGFVRNALERYSQSVLGRQQSEENKGLLRLGYARFYITERHARLDQYFPKDTVVAALGAKAAPGLGGLLLKSALEHVKKRFGVTTGSTYPVVSFEARRQSDSLGVPVGTPIPISEWIGKLDRKLEPLLRRRAKGNGAARG